MREYLLQFGGKVTTELESLYEQSPNWQDGKFANLEDTDVEVSLSKMPGIIYKQIVGKDGQVPDEPLPVAPFDMAAFLAPAQQVKFIWYGHSVVLLRMQGKTILIDPMLGPDTTPIAPFATARFSENTLDLIDDFPEIDLILLTHDHYDHLDYDSIQKLKAKTKQYFVALGVKRHLVAWGVDTDKIQEFDWWDTASFSDVHITFTPTQHFSGRGLTDRMKALWGGWALRSKQGNIWFSGDGGYAPHFELVGQRLGPFDFAFMECGQYNDDWHPVHLFPHEAVQAALDAGVRKAMPVHWAGFPLSYQHTWQEPAEDFVVAATAQNLDYTLPRLGQLSAITDKVQEKWWVKY